MRLDDELRQMLRDADRAQARRSGWTRLWRHVTERLSVAAVAVAPRLLSDRLLPIDTTGIRVPAPRGPLMLIDDLRHALRRLKSRPGTAFTCVAMLAVAIGLSAAMFTVADHLLITPAPYRDPSALVEMVAGLSETRFHPTFAAAQARAFAESPAFTAVEGAAQEAAVIEGSAGLISANGARVSPGLFEMLGVAPILGRAFLPGEGRSGADDPVILSESTWRSAFGSDPGIIGRVVHISNQPVRVVGVMPAWFSFPFWTTKVWRPVDLAAPPQGFAGSQVQVYGRLAPHVSRAAGAAAATGIASGAGALKSGEHVLLRGVTDGFLDRYSQSAVVALSGGVALVFLVLCANVANLVLARTTARRVEYSIASAIGASRARILREAILENAAIGTVAAVVGLAIGAGLTALARTWLPDSIASRTMNPIALDLRAVAAASICGVLAVLIAGVPPAWIGTRVNAADSLRLTARGATESSLQRRWTSLMLVAEVALASTLLIGAGLLATSFVRLMLVDPGMDTTHVMTAWVSLPTFNFADRAARTAEARELEQRMAAIPGISAASLSFGLPPGGGRFSFGWVAADTGRRLPDSTVVFSQNVGPGFFDVFGIKMLEGRRVEPTDTDHQVVVSRHLADELWPGSSAVGHSFTTDGDAAPNEVVGVAAEVHSTLADPNVEVPEYYRRFTPGSSEVMLGLRCGAVCPSEATLREALHQAAPGAIVAQAGALDTRYLTQFEKPRAAAALAVAFAGIALVAAAAGLFSVLTYAVGRRRREFGIRVALGAEPRRLTRLVIGDGLLVSSIGLAIGSAGAIGLGRWLSSLAYGVTVGTPIVWVVVIGAVLTATIAASWRPARTAATADPSELLRET